MAGVRFIETPCYAAATSPLEKEAVKGSNEVKNKSHNEELSCPQSQEQQGTGRKKEFFHLDLFFNFISFYFSLETFLPTFLKVELGRWSCHRQISRQIKSSHSLAQPWPCLQHQYSKVKVTRQFWTAFFILQQPPSFPFSKEFPKRKGRTSFHCFP